MSTAVSACLWSGVRLLESLPVRRASARLDRGMLEDGTFVMLKRWSPGAPDSELRQVRLLREGEVLQRLRGAQGVVPVLAVDAGGAIMLAWASGGDLASWRALTSAVDDSRLLAWAADIGSALLTAHACGIVHRDVKPTNVLIHQSGAWLADWELAAFGSPRAGLPDGWVEESIGTAEFAAPELLTSPARAVACSVDVYGYCALLHWMFKSHLTCRVGALTPLADVIRRGLAHEPANRPALPDVLAALGA